RGTVDPARPRAIETARARWLGELGVATPRARLMVLRARLNQFQRAARRREWEPQATVAARWGSAGVAARQRLLDRAPAEVMQITASADEAAVREALAAAVESALFELHAGDRLRHSNNQPERELGNAEKKRS